MRSLTAALAAALLAVTASTAAAAARPGDDLAFASAIFRAAHNSYSGNVDGTKGSIAYQLDNGVRFLELDIHDNGYATAADHPIGHDSPAHRRRLGEESDGARLRQLDRQSLDESQHVPAVATAMAKWRERVKQTGLIEAWHAAEVTMQHELIRATAAYFAGLKAALDKQTAAASAVSP